jgi:hypothetical protein
LPLPVVAQNKMIANEAQTTNIDLNLALLIMMEALPVFGVIEVKRFPQTKKPNHH